MNLLKMLKNIEMQPHSYKANVDLSNAGCFFVSYPDAEDKAVVLNYFSLFWVLKGIFW